MNEAEILKMIHVLSETTSTLAEGIKVISVAMNTYNVGLKGLHDRLVILEQRPSRSWISRIFGRQR
ncbi:hypothetical protein LCGC14_1255880 [marine sediment metagenome]|uniref:Uncharacterized protein n=1 Tax=marine sediment metagenome TaxID=412755 RepID=A0A0F9P5K2_9ZZZZ